MTSRGLRAAMAAVLCGWAVVPVMADDLAKLQGLRAQIIGPAIARSAEFTAHSPQAERAGNEFRCRQPAASGMTDAEYQARYNAIQQAAQARNAAILKEKMELMNARRMRPPMPLEEYQAKMKVLDARQSAAAEQAHEEGKRLEQERLKARSEASDYVAITLQHAPRDERATIVPFAGQLPAPSFVAELNRVLQPFLATCGDREQVSVSHVYRDLFPMGGVDVERRYEKPVTAFHYTLRGGVLSLNPQANNAKWVAAHGYSNDARFTLASARQKWERALAESNRAGATYRRDFGVLAKRQAGIVYKLDPYWEQYKVDPTWDAVRRVFDGDFTGQKATWQFKSAFYLFGDIYSQRCKSEVEEFVEHRLPYSAIVRTRTYMDGRIEHDRETRVMVVHIDKRFEPQWRSYEPASLKHILVAAGNITEEMGSLASATNAKILEALRKSQQMSMYVQFFKTHACGSAAMVQLRENLVRVANDRPSAQQEGVRLPNAERESDPGR
jgi:hypothetical protein